MSLVPATPSPGTAAALRLGWAVAEVRGRYWPEGPRPRSVLFPTTPPDVLPLRFQRSFAASRHEATSSLFALADQVGLAAAEESSQLLSSVTAVQDAEEQGNAAADLEARWREAAAHFLIFDARIQDHLTQQDEAQCNAYLLSRGLAECYWGLGPVPSWTQAGAPTAVAPSFLLGDARRQELSRLLGRLEPGAAHPMTAAAISGTLEAWGEVAADERWCAAPDLRERLYEQVRRWYELVVLTQDPTTMIRPYAALGTLRGVARSIRMFWPQVLLATIAVALVTGFLTLTGGPAPEWVSSLLATSGVSAVVAAGLLTRGQGAAQRMLTRMRQDAYTDLVSVSVTVLPSPPAGRDGEGTRRARQRLEAAVRRRRLTPPTAPPPS